MLYKSFRYLLLPVSFIYAAIIWFRNWLYDKNILKSSSFNFPVICVGNLAVGGTGKTPMTELLVEFLKANYVTATLSRGYKRQTKGFSIADENSTANEIGDEPMQFHLKFPGVTIAVGEERLVAIPQLLHQRPATQVIILDDAFQHRQVKAGLNVVLTDYKNLYTRDMILPAGNLRDVKQSMKRAHIIVVTKCPTDLSENERVNIAKEINPASHQQLYFSEIVYGAPYHIFQQEPALLDGSSHVLLVCGIANPMAIKNHLQNTAASFQMLRYADHHIFTSDDLKNIKKHFEQVNNSNKLIITTEKDAVRLLKFREELSDYPVFALPIQHRILFNKEEDFKEKLINFIHSFPQKDTS